MAKITSKLPEVPVPVALLLIGLASLCFTNSYDGKFVFDDSVAIVSNADVKDNHLSDVFFNDFWGTKLSNKQSHRSYRPLTVLTFRFHYWLRGYLEPIDFHVVNILLHSVVCLLTFFVFKILLEGKDTIAFYGALLFAVHPCHTEAVSGIVGRADVLCAFFVWLSLISHNHCIFAKRRVFKALSMVSCFACTAAAIMCKEIGITAIGICGLYDVIIVNKISPAGLKNPQALKKMLSGKWRLLIRLLALCAGGVVFIVLRFSIMGFTAPTFQPIDNPASFLDSILLRFVNYNYIYCLNIWLLLCPEWLCFDWSMGCVPLIRDYDPRIIAIFAMWIVMGALIFVVFCGRDGDNTRHVGMSLALLIVPFLPASNIFFHVGFVLAERTLYLPSAGYCLLVAIGLDNLMRRFPKSKIHIFLYGTMIFLYFARSWMRSDQWRHEETLFNSALRVCPLNAKVHFNIAKIAADLGNETLAELEYREAVRLNPNYAHAMNNLGNLMKDRGNYEEAEKLFKRALQLRDDFSTAWMNLGVVLSALKKYNESERSYEAALYHRPLCPDCHYNLGVLYLEMKEHERALQAWKNAITQKANHRRAWVNRVRLLEDMGKWKEALAVGRKALKVIPDDAVIHFNIANILGRDEKFEEAEEEFKQAIAMDPNNPTFLTNFGVLYHRWNKYKEAGEYYRKALEINPNFQTAKDNVVKLTTKLRKIERRVT